MTPHRLSRALLPATIVATLAVAAALAQDSPAPAPLGADASRPAPPPVLRDAVFRYEGQITWDGAPFAGALDLEFRLHDALVGGTQIGQPVAAPGLELADGLIGIDLDFDALLVVGRPYWLEVAADGTVLQPRQMVVLPAVRRHDSIGIPVDEAVLLQGEETTGPRASRDGTAGGRGGASARAGHEGSPLGQRGPGAYAPPTSSGDEGGTAGGGGIAGGGPAWGVNGTSLFYNGGNVGIGTDSPARPLTVITPSTDAQTRAILGHASGGFGVTIGISGQSDSPSGRGLFGVATAPVGPSIGLFGLANSKNGTGLFGLANSATGVTTGLTGQVVSPDGFALRALGAKSYFNGKIGIGTTTPAASLDIFAGDAIVRNTGGQNTVILTGESDASGGGIDLKQSDGDTGLRLRGDQGSGDGGFVAVRDSAGNTTIEMDGDGRLTMSTATGEDTFTVLSANGPSSTLLMNELDGSIMMVVIDGNLTLYNSSGVPTISLDGDTGGKSAVVETATHGRRLLYAQESPEVWFEDFGSGRLVNGQARIDLDPIFLQTVTIDQAHPMKVFLTPGGDCNGLYVERHLDHFVVRELRGGSSTVDFDYRVVAKRKGLEDVRLEPVVDRLAGTPAAARP